jgi:hypothetical protein
VLRMGMAAVQHTQPCTSVSGLCRSVRRLTLRASFCQTGEKGDRGDDLSQLVCADGAIHRIPEGGCALCLVRDVDDGGVWVWT